MYTRLLQILCEAESQLLKSFVYVKFKELNFFCVIVGSFIFHYLILTGCYNFIQTPMAPEFLKMCCNYFLQKYYVVYHNILKRFLIFSDSFKEIT